MEVPVEELKKSVRIQILPPPAQSPEPVSPKPKSLPHKYPALLFLAVVFSLVSLYLAFAA